SFGKPVVKFNPVSAKVSVAKRHQRSFGIGGIPFGQGGHQPNVSNSWKFGWVIATNGVDDLTHGSRVGLPVQFYSSARDLCLDIVEFNGEYTIIHCDYIRVSSQSIIGDRNLIQGASIAGIKLQRAL